MRVEDKSYAAEQPKDEFVVGVAVGEAGAAFYYLPLVAAGAVNERVGDVPIVVVAVADTRVIRMFSQLVGDRELTFRLAGGLLIDEETGTTWDPSHRRCSRGIAGRGASGTGFTHSFV